MRRSAQYFNLKAIAAATLLAVSTSVAFGQKYYSADAARKRETCAAIGCTGGHILCGTAESTGWQVYWALWPNLPIMIPFEYEMTCYELPYWQ